MSDESKPKIDRTQIEDKRARDAEESAAAQKVNRVDQWQTITLADVFEPQTKRASLVAGLIKQATLSIWFGAPGTSKSLLIADLCVACMTGTRWLGAFDVMQCRTAWLDLDNGADETRQRFSAFLRSHGITSEADAKKKSVIAPVIWSLPLPRPNGADTALMLELSEWLRKEKISVLVIDNLGRIAAGIDEKDGAIDQVMAHLRYIAESTGVAVIVIHHAVKNASDRARKGDALRGHSSIEASVDLAMMVTREAGSNVARVECVKSRRMEPKPFFAAFEYAHVPGTDDELQTAKFSLQKIQTADEKILDSAFCFLDEHGEANQTQLLEAIEADLEDEKNLRSKLKQVLKTAQKQGLLACHAGERKAIIWFRKDKSGGVR